MLSPWGRVEVRGVASEEPAGERECWIGGGIRRTGGWDRGVDGRAEVGALINLSSGGAVWDWCEGGCEKCRSAGTNMAAGKPAEDCETVVLERSGTGCRVTWSTHVEMEMH